MAAQWMCDICGAPGYIHPQTELVTRKKTMTIEVPDPKNPTEKIVKKISRDIPQTEVVRRQVTQTSRVETVEIPKMRDVQPRAILVQLSFGHQNVQKDFCMECFNGEIKEKVDELFDFLCKIQDR